MRLKVIKPGLLTTLQDMGRSGHARLGVAPSGAMDGPALRLANALVGNAPGAAALELTIIGPVLQLERDAVLALTGAPIDARIDDLPVPLWRPISIRAGATLRLAGMRQGARSYLAIAGGLLAPNCLGSASVDLNAGIGRALRAGDWLAIGPGAPSHADVSARSWPSWSLASAHWFETQGRPIRAVVGAHFDALTLASQQQLFRAEFGIAQDANRVGYRLQGTRLGLAHAIELVSEAVDFGTVQLPPGGDPIVLMAEHPTTGGYPRIAQIAAVDLPYLAQRRPGEMLRLERIDAGQAEQLWLEQERALQALIAEIGRRSM